MERVLVEPAQVSSSTAPEIVAPDANTNKRSHRRHDLDALRAFAMLLGIALHASLSFSGIPWTVQDSQQNPLFGIFMASVHGFRMQLFFLLSGFFTMMLYRKRGLSGLLKQRVARILLPFVIGCFTIVPVVNAVGFISMTYGRNPVTSSIKSNAPRDKNVDAYWEALITGNSEKQKEWVGKVDVNALHPEMRVTPLAWSALKGDIASVRLLLDHGAVVDQKNEDGSRPLQAAAFAGRAEVVKLLLEKGADPKAKGQDGSSAWAATTTDYGVVQWIAGALLQSPPTQDELEQGRKEVREILARAGAAEGPVAGPQTTSADTAWGRFNKFYLATIFSERMRVGEGFFSWHPVSSDLFHHLWFLWFLFWMVLTFVLVQLVLGWLGWTVSFPNATAGWWRWIWIIPVTMLPQMMMGQFFPNFGPDTSTGLVLQPHVFVYYLIFFSFGAWYFAADDREAKLGRYWWILIPIAVLVFFPIGFVSLGNRPLTDLFQVLYAWSMAFGLIGLFRATLRTEKPWIRYLSDASYWLYLTHLPLVMLVQFLIRDWQMNSILKFIMINLVVTGSLLFLYHFMVRSTWIGVLLNGPRGNSSRVEVATASVVAE